MCVCVCVTERERERGEIQMPCTCRCGVHLKKNAWPWTAYTGFHACTLCICKSQPRQWCNPLLSRTLHTHTHTHHLYPYISSSISPSLDIFSLPSSLSLSLSLSPAIDLQIPRPDKKSGAKKQMKGMEDLLRSIAGNPHLRSNQAFITFLRPDDQFGSFTENDHSEVVSQYCIIHTLPRGP